MQHLFYSITWRKKVCKIYLQTKHLRKEFNMIMPIIAYGHPVLKKETQDIDENYPKLQELISDMWETMYNAEGIGLAAPQVGLGIRLFLVDTHQFGEKSKNLPPLKQVFINATILEETGKEWGYDEGCLSIPNINGEVMRPPKIKVEYYDENFEFHTKEFEGVNARVIQHEYDHVDGILFIEHLKPLKKRLIKKKLEKIRLGKINPRYRMKFYTPPKK